MKRVLLLAFAGLLLAGSLARSAPAKDDDKEGTIAGIPIQRPQGGWLGVELAGNTFRLTFYNDKKKPTPADCSSAVFRWPVHYQPNDERTELLPTDDPAVFASPYPVKPPYSFKLHIALLKTGSSEVESYVIDFSA